MAAATDPFAAGAEGSTLPDVGVALESVLCTDELNRRPSRPPDYETENRALVTLSQALPSHRGLSCSRWPIAAGFHMHLSKPVEPPALIEPVARLAHRER